MTPRYGTIEALIEDFALFDDWESRYSYLIDLGKKLSPLSDDEKNDLTRVKGCVSKVWLVAEEKDGRSFYRAESDASIVSGILYLLLSLYDGKTWQEMAPLNAQDLLKAIGLENQITPNRRQGMDAVERRMKQFAAEKAGAA